MEEKEPEQLIGGSYKMCLIQILSAVTFGTSNYLELNKRHESSILDISIIGSYQSIEKKYQEMNKGRNKMNHQMTIVNSESGIEYRRTISKYDSKVFYICHLTDKAKREGKYDYENPMKEIEKASKTIGGNIKMIKGGELKKIIKKIKGEYAIVGEGNKEVGDDEMIPLCLVRVSGRSKLTGEGMSRDVLIKYSEYLSQEELNTLISHIFRNDRINLNQEKNGKHYFIPRLIERSNEVKEYHEYYVSMTKAYPELAEYIPLTIAWEADVRGCGLEDWKETLKKEVDSSNYQMDHGRKKESISSEEFRSISESSEKEINKEAMKLTKGMSRISR